MPIATQPTLSPQLEELRDVCTQSNWDGFDAPALDAEVFEVAARFLESLPQNLPAPELGASAAGDVSFEWETSSTCVVSVGVSANGQLHYAALEGNKRTFGSMPVGDQVDELLLSLIRRIGGRADLPAECVLAQSTRVERDDTPQYHANILGWPVESKEAQRMKALELAAGSTLVLRGG